jgi:DNA repair exonuclease SbcCD ATPase subunit
VARRSGSPISLLVIDEPEGLDVESRKAFGQALRAIAHRGDLDRVLVVSHYDDIADFADLVLRVEKVDGASHVDAVAA